MTRTQRGALVAFVAFLVAAHELRNVVAMAIFLALAFVAAWVFVNEERTE